MQTSLWSKPKNPLWRTGSDLRASGRGKAEAKG